MRLKVREATLKRLLDERSDLVPFAAPADKQLLSYNCWLMSKVFRLSLVADLACSWAMLLASIFRSCLISSGSSLC